MLLGTLGASLLGNMLTRKEMLKPGYGKKWKGMIRAASGSLIKNIFWPHPIL